MLWVLFLFISLGSLLNLTLLYREDGSLPWNQSGFWPLIEGISSWIHVLFFLFVAFLLIHHSLGFQSGLLRDIRRRLRFAHPVLRVSLKGYFFFWLVFALDASVGFTLRHLAPDLHQQFIEGTQFFRLWDSLDLQTVSIGVVLLFLLAFGYGYSKCAPWDRKPKSVDTLMRRQGHLTPGNAKLLRKAERLIEGGKRYRAAIIYEKLGNQYSYRAAKLFQRVGRLERAKQNFILAGKLFESQERYDRAGEAFFQAESWHQAKNQMQKIFLAEDLREEMPDFDNLVEHYGQTLYQLGEYEQAGRHYSKYNQHLQAASCFEKSGQYDLAGQAYSKAGAHDKSYQVLSESGIMDMAGIEKCRWLLGESRILEAARCFEKNGFFSDAAAAYEKQGMTLAAAQAYFSAEKYEKAALLFIEIGDDDKAVDCYEQLGDYKKASELAAYMGLQDRQGELFLKAGDYLAALRSFIMIGNMKLASDASCQVALDDESQVKQFIHIINTLLKNQKAKEAVSCLESALNEREPNAVNIQLFQLLAGLKKKMGYGASSAEIKIRLALLFPDRENLVTDATLASKETGIPFQLEQTLDETVAISRPETSGPTPKRRIKEKTDATATQTFDQDIILDLTGGEVMGRFEIIKEIGRGGMGLVYKARDRRLDRMVAFKMLHPEFNKDPKTVMFFKREARFVAQLNHPNIVTLFDVGYQKGCFYLVMEYVDGITLTQLLKKYSSYIHSNFLALWYEASLGLQHAHAAGVLHRDIKPSNIMITKDRHVRVMDFGLAKNADDPTHSDQAWGTPAFLAPELEESPKASFQSDIYSLGATFYLLATGQVPFQNAQTGSSYAAEALPESPEKLVPGMSPDLSRTILKCLYRDPVERYRSVKELLTAIKLLGNMKIKLFS